MKKAFFSYYFQVLSHYNNFRVKKTLADPISPMMEFIFWPGICIVTWVMTSSAMSIYTSLRLLVECFLAHINAGFLHQKEKERIPAHIVVSEIACYSLCMFCNSLQSEWPARSPRDHPATTSSTPGCACSLDIKNSTPAFPFVRDVTVPR